MFEKKKLWMALASVTLVAACGGGNGGPSTDPAPTNPGNETPSTDTTLSGGYVQISPANQILVNALLPLSAYESEEADGGLWGQAKGTNDLGENNGAPFETFGLRISRNALPTEQGGTISTDPATGRLAITLTERAESIQPAEVAESMTIVMTGITISAGEGGAISVSQAENASMLVSGTAANGDAISNIEVALPAGAVSLADVDTLPNGEADSTSIGLVFDIDSAFDAATPAQATELAKLADLSGRFTMNFAFSAADIYRSGTGGAADTQLADQTIDVEGSADVVGSGIPGNIWIDYTHPNQ